MPKGLFLSLWVVFASPAFAVDGFESCRGACPAGGASVQAERQNCIRNCGVRFPDKGHEFCPELGPCQALCDANFPKPLPDRTKGDPWVACNGECLQKYMRFGCEAPPPPHEPGPSNESPVSPVGGASGSSGASGAFPLSAAPRQLTRSPPRTATPAPAQPARGETAGAADTAELGLLKDKRIDTSRLGSLSPTTPLEALVQSAVRSESEPTIFQRVNRKYHDKFW